MIVLGIDTSCDDTCVAVVEDLKIRSNVVSSQISLHKNWGGVVPNLARMAHEERMEEIFNRALRMANVRLSEVDVVAVTQGPGLAPCLQVGIEKAKEIAKKNKKKLVAVNHIEGHILSPLLKKNNGVGNSEIKFPALALTVSGGHTQLVEVVGIGKYKILGETLDDAAGEALDKAAKMLGLGYPGGPIIEQLAKKGRADFLKLPIPMRGKAGLDFSFSGLKTSFFYQVREMDEKYILDNLENLCASFLRAVAESLTYQTRRAIEKYHPKSMLAVGKVMSNLYLRKKIRSLAREKELKVFFPISKKLNTDNAAMIAGVGYFKALRGEFWEEVETLDREPKLPLI